DAEQAEADFSYAAAEHARIGSPVWLARTQLEWGDMLLSRRDPADVGRAKRLIREARGTGVKLGLVDIERRAERLLSDCCEENQP
ncbi:MAG: hypothetical protein LC808_35005, partial [Actinobacteria bacterium]|nr:hypothetical protein [Actinomycetota bacterium]